MKNCFYLLCCIFILAACQEKSLSGPIQVDLSKTEPVINYSSFVDSTAFVTLELSDSLPINGVSGLFLMTVNSLSRIAGRKAFLSLMKKRTVICAVKCVR